MEIVVLQIVVLLCLVLLNSRTRTRFAERERARLEMMNTSQQVAMAIQGAVKTLTQRYDLKDQLLRQRALLEASKAVVTEASQRPSTDEEYARLLGDCQQQATQVACAETAISDVTLKIEALANQWRLPRKKHPKRDNSGHLQKANFFAGSLPRARV